MWETGEKLVRLRWQRGLAGAYRKMMEVYNMKDRARAGEESKCSHVFSAEVG